MTPLMEAMLTMDPPSRARMCGMVYFETSAVPITLTPSTFSQSATSACSTFFCKVGGIIDQNVDSAKTLDCHLRDPVCARLLRNTRDRQNRLGPEVTDFFQSRLARMLADVVEHEFRAFLGKANGYGLTDTRTYTGDDGNLVGKPHGSQMCDYLETGTG